MTDAQIQRSPIDGLQAYAGAISDIPNGSVGWMAPNRLRQDGEHLFIQRDTVVVAEMKGAATLAVFKVNDEVHVFDEHVFMTDRWWNYHHQDSYHYPNDYGIYVRSLIRGGERHRDETSDGRVVGNCAWGANYKRFAGPLESMPIGSFGYVDMKQLYRSDNSIYLLQHTTVCPSLEGETCLQVMRFHDGIFVFDGDVPEACRWWNRPHSAGPRNGFNTHVRGLLREHEWRRHYRQAA